MNRRDSSEAELDRLHVVCNRMGGFDGRISLEWVDGSFAALLAGPRVPEPAEWLPRLFGDSWERTFADPDDAAQALAALNGRWAVLRSQLDPESLADDPDALRLGPLMMAAAEGDDAAASVDEPPVGAEWAQGFLDVVADPHWGWGWDWGDNADLAPALAAIGALVLAPDALQAHVAERHPGRTPTRDDLIDDACWAVQDLRLWWIDHAPRTAPRRVDAAPGRNDPCPCGSGRKYKRCHGTA